MPRFILFVIVYGVFAVVPSVNAEPDCGDCTQSLAPRLWIPDGDPATDQLPLKSSHAEVKINGPIAQVRITQQYRNTGTRPINARYVFPGSTRAAVHGLTMKIGERLIKAKIDEKNAAKQVFEQAKQEGKRAALLAQQRPNIFMMDVANLVPGDTVELTLDYSELLVPEQGVYAFVYPTVVGPRYGSDPFQIAEDAAWIANPYTEGNGAVLPPAEADTSINVMLESPIAVKDLQSVQHEIETVWHNEKSADIVLAPSEIRAGNRDFILRFRLQDNQIVSGLMTYSKDDQNYFLMMAQPPVRVRPAHILKREYLFMLDVSGSMHGFPLDTAKNLMRALLSGLRPDESFNILFFSGGSSALSPEPLPATPGNVQRALATLSSFDGGGGTELVSALKSAYAMPRRADTARSLVVVTDGFINAERDCYDLIAENLNSTNVFAFGIGSSVNRYLIETLAKAGAGEPFIVTAANDVADVGLRFRRFVEAPLLANIRLQGNDVELYDLEPADIPVMLAQRPIVVFGKYRGQSDSATLELNGTAVSGAYRVEMPLFDAAGKNRAELLPLLWARHRIMRLSDWTGKDGESNRDAILELGLNFSLLTRYTAFVAVDDVVANTEKGAKNVHQPLPLPQGVSTLALAEARPMPEPELLWLALLLWVSFMLNALFRKAAHVRD